MVLVTTTTETAPWWYVAALAGGFAILGGVIGQVGGLLSDRRKLLREDRAHWDNVILKGALNILDTTAELRSLAHSDSEHYIEDPEMRRAKYVEGLNQIETDIMRMQLVASPGLADAAVALWATASKESGDGGFAFTNSDPRLDVTNLTYAQAAMDFRRRTRNELRARR